MSYIDYANNFWARGSYSPYSAGQIALFFIILDAANKAYWEEWIPISLSTIASKAQMSRAGIMKAKDELVARGILDYRVSGEKKRGEFKLLANEKQRKS